MLVYNSLQFPISNLFRCIYHDKSFMQSPSHCMSKLECMILHISPHFTFLVWEISQNDRFLIAKFKDKKDPALVNGMKHVRKMMITPRSCLCHINTRRTPKKSKWNRAGRRRRVSQPMGRGLRSVSGSLYAE